MTHPLPPDPDRAVLARLGQQVDPPPEAYRRLVGRLQDTGRIGRPGRLAGWLGAALAATAAVAIAVALFPPAPAGAEFLLLLEEPAGYQVPRDPTEARARVVEYTRWARTLARENRLVTAGELEPRGVAVGPAASRPLGGPMTPTGYFLLRAGSLEEAERLARESPHLRYGGEVIVRPVVH